MSKLKRPSPEAINTLRTVPNEAWEDEDFRAAVRLIGVAAVHYLITARSLRSLSTITRKLKTGKSLTSKDGRHLINAVASVAYYAYNGATGAKSTQAKAKKLSAKLNAKTDKFNPHAKAARDVDIESLVSTIFDPASK